MHRLNDRGEPVPGLRKINEAEAEIVRGIFSRYQSGEPLLRICEWLNGNGIPSPKGSRWQKSALVGTFSRQTGILRNTLYKGVVTFDKMAYRKHPDTGKRLSVVRPEHQWIKVPAPELSIVSEAQFDAVQILIEERSTRFRQDRLLVQVMTEPEKLKRRNDYQRIWRARQIKSPRKSREQPLYLTSGKLWCPRHGTAFIYRRSCLHGCPEKGCANRNLAQNYVMPLVIAALQRFNHGDIERFYSDQEPMRAELQRTLEEVETRRSDVQQQIRNLLTSIARSQRGPETLSHIQELEKESGRLKLDAGQLRAKVDAITRLPHVVIADIVKNFHLALSRHSSDQHATKLIHSCISRIEIFPEWNEAEQSMQHRARVHFDIPELIKTLHDAAVATAA